MKTQTFGAVAASILIGSSVLLAPAATAAPASTVIAVDQSGVVIAQDQTSQLRAVPSAPRAITVTTEPGTLVTVQAPGVKSQARVTNKIGQATFAKLKAGKTYTVSTNDDDATVVPVIKVGRASDLTIMTTDQPGTIQATWQHKATKARGDVGYTLTATPLGSRQDDDVITTESTTTEADLTGLDPLVMYEFSVTPHNALGNGKASTATMNRTLAAITGLPTLNDAKTDQSPNVEADQADNATDEAEKVTPVRPVTPAPQPAPKPAPGPAPQPSTRTIWICPSEYNDVNGVCTQERAYTFTETTETAPYTYSENFHQTGWQDESFAPAPCTFGTYHANGPQGEGCYVAAGPTGYYTTDKDAAPTGWTDDGSQYTRTVSSKDETPEGFSDNGSVWVRTAEKIAKVVPA